MSLQHQLRRLARLIGIDAQRANLETIAGWRLVHMLKVAGVDTVLDVGANVGQFALELRENGYRGRIVSFEPMLDAHEALMRAAEGDPDWIVAAPMALGASSGMHEFHIAGNSVSSSLLEMAELHVEGAPQSREVGKVLVKVEPLDNVVGDYVPRDARIFMKADTQGAEEQVIAGATATIGRMHGIMVELSMAELYIGQSLFLNIYQLIEGMGFDCWDITPAFRNPETMRLLQVDAIFFRKNPVL